MNTISTPPLNNHYASQVPPENPLGPSYRMISTEPMKRIEENRFIPYQTETEPEPNWTGRLLEKLLKIVSIALTANSENVLANIQRINI